MTRFGRGVGEGGEWLQEAGRGFKGRRLEFREGEEARRKEGLEVDRAGGNPRAQAWARTDQIWRAFDIPAPPLLFVVQKSQTL